MEEEVTLMVLDRLGNLSTSDDGNNSVISTHQTLTFTAQLDSGHGADFVWNVTSLRGFITHIAPSNLGLIGKSDISFVRPDIYTVKVSLMLYLWSCLSFCIIERVILKPI